MRGAHHRHPGRAAAGLLLALVALLGGCSDDEPAGVATTTTTSTPATRPMTASTVPTSTTAPPATASTTSTAAPTTTAAPPTLRCRTVAFTPGTEDAASDVIATGLPCDEAEAFVRAAGTRTSSGGPDEVEVEGYRCVRTATGQDPLPTSSYECTSGGRTVTFVRS